MKEMTIEKGSFYFEVKIPFYKEKSHIIDMVKDEQVDMPID